MVQVGDRLRYNSDWLDDEHSYVEGIVDKILRDEASGERFAYIVKSELSPDTLLVPLDNIGEDGEYEVVEDN
ncbi:hypothetical protein [Haloarcula laminariae]|uniref:hypothetical protein n=1 Tax=Haloarcula laminariae TaxID=2961577 RepID=UPI0021C9EFBC|nr:hypothetical protein [Halomicroarcula laminariae]